MQGFIGVIAVVSVIALAALAGAVVLGRSVAKGGGPRTWLWMVLLAIVGATTLFAAQIAMVYYRMPVGWIAGLVLGIAAVIALFVRVGLDIAWHKGRVIALVGFLMLMMVALVAVMVIAPAGNVMVPLFEARAQQIGDAFGFEALLPTGEQIVTESLPVEAVTEPEEALRVEYQQFSLQESMAEGPLAEADLRGLLAPGVEPFGLDGPVIPDDARYTALEVRGNPALGVEYVLSAEKAIGGSAPETIHVLAFELDGVEVRMLARNGVRYTADGGDEPYSALSLDRLAEIAETLEPIER